MLCYLSWKVHIIMLSIMWESKSSSLRFSQHTGWKIQHEIKIGCDQRGRNSLLNFLMERLRKKFKDKGRMKKQQTSWVIRLRILYPPESLHAVVSISQFLSHTISIYFYYGITHICSLANFTRFFIRILEFSLTWSKALSSKHTASFWR